MEDSHLYRMVASSLIIGFLISLLKDTLTDSPTTAKKAFFRGLLNGLLSTSSLTLLIFIPEVESIGPNLLTMGIMGASAFIGSLGTTGIEAILKKKIDKG